MYNPSDVLKEKCCPDFGRYFVAKISLEPGESVFVEAPLLVAPSNEGFKLEVEKFICIGCYKVVEKLKCQLCSRCRWFVCSEECSNESWHRDFECTLFSALKIVPNRRVLQYVYLVRGLLIRDRDETKWKSILNLSSEVSVTDEEYEAELADEIEGSHSFINKYCKIKAGKGIIERLMKIFVVNEFNISDIDKAGNKYHGGAIFSIGCLMAHSCIANLDWNVSSVDDDDPCSRWHLSVSTFKPVKVGDVLSIRYLNYYSFGTLQRRQKLANELHFWCKCERCVDSSELGSNFSALVCHSCKEIMLPMDPLDMNTNWKCTQCPVTLTQLTVERLETAYNHSLDLVLKNTSNVTACKHLENLISKCSKNYMLYKTHRLVICATMNWLSRTNMDVLLGRSNRINDLYNTMIVRAQQCLHVLSLVGSVTDCVSCEFKIASIIVKYRLKSKESKSVECGDDEYTLKEMKAILQRILKHLARGIRLVKQNSFSSTAGKFMPEMTEMYQFYFDYLSSLDSQAQISDD